MACDGKCTPILRVSALSGTGNLKAVGNHGEITDPSQTTKEKGYVVWWDNATEDFDSADDVDDAAGISGTAPRRVCQMFFKTLTAVDGECPEDPGGDGACVAYFPIGECDVQFRVRWIWDGGTEGQRYGLGIPKGTLYDRDCEFPGISDVVDITTPADHWESLQLPASPGDTVAQRSFGTTFRVKKCGTLEKYRIQFYDVYGSPATPRDGLVDSYIDVAIGCEPCCGKDTEYPVVPLP